MTATAPTTSPLTGGPVSTALVRAVAEDPTAPRTLAVTGPAGSGKSVVLRELSRVWSASGAEVARTPGAEPGRVVVVDDAHELTDEALDELRAFAGDPGARLVVAFRPWPRGRALARLGAALASSAPPLVLGSLDAAGVVARAVLITGSRPSDETVRVVLERTAGSPLLVDRLLAAAGGASGVPPELAEQLGYAIDAEDRRVVDLVTATALGAPQDSEVLVPLLGLADAAGSGIDELDELVQRAVAAGLCTPDGRVVPLVGDAVRGRVPPARRTELRRSLAEIELDRGGSVLAVARTLRGSGATGDRAAAVFRAAAVEAARSEHPDAVRFYAEAVAAGTAPLTVAARRAEAHLVAGDLDGALGHADAVLSATDAVEPEDAVRAGSVAAAVLARRGLLARSAELYRWTAAVAGERLPAAAVPVLIGTGAWEEAREIGGAGAIVPGRAPTLVDGADDLTARGILDSVQGSPTAALSGLARAAGLLESAHGAALLPDTPAALAALVAVHTGEFDVASSVLDRALRTGLGGVPARSRHRLLLGWIALLRGATGPAAERLDAVDADAAGRPLEPRDEFLAAALQVAIARRNSDLGALMRAWTRARQAIVRHPVDLFVLQPLGELVTAATRLREESWVRPHLDEAQTLLDQLGRPALWAAPLHWAQLQAAILVDDADAAREQTAALERAACGSRFAQAMATAAPHWVGVIEGRVDAEAVEAAARGLHAVGLSFDGGRLAGQAALRTDDRRAVSALLACARALQVAGAEVRTASPQGGGADGAGRAGARGPAATGPGGPAAGGPGSGPQGSGPGGTAPGRTAYDGTASGGAEPVRAAPGGTGRDGRGSSGTASGAAGADGTSWDGTSWDGAGSGGRAVPGRAAGAPGPGGDTGAGPDRAGTGAGAHDQGRAAAAGDAARVEPPPSLLSDRELEVAELVVQGRTHKEIGEALFISAKTVEHHVARIRQRLGVSGRSELLDELRRILEERG
ncbi:MULTISPECIES: LuxR C-terminal-related transcriptional regulator [Pseudonocardia]|uniref:Spore germination protein GerE n=2 Tax=Pseudonocardia TaxID=1847 RepID=A0A1Y2MMG5_PSEAH|nr:MULTISPECIES: LuxR C-terminal-related transcriptional regulator [Pseudonocardia]OSY36454.1 Spore germination protein GerE [Pseudonocardia autotrophica]TDN74746.1 regulatory LuxR family protein [Pseudonocardia autotrophica]BBG05521.1 helix-turn-helix transcriptional regulator [Pseudonocardia autotrophica]GEC28046.1 helix-turn-helix transcriptional regulator [Pseudonocardia saturnea]